MNPIIQAYVEFVAARARKFGYEAFEAGAVRRAPLEFGEYAGAWVEGWNTAALDSFGALADTRGVIA